MNSIAHKITIFAKIYLVKSFLFILLFFSTSLLIAQERQQTKQGNVFDSSSSAVNEPYIAGDAPGTTASGDAGLEGDDRLAPIDDYIPLLVMTAVGIIMYKAHKKRNLLS